MHCAQKMTHNIYWIGSNDWTTERFENLFPIPNGVSYNSYFIDEEKTCVVDSVDAEIREEYFDNLSHLLNGRDLDYIIVNHMEPDHCQTLLETLERYPNCKMVGNATTFRMFEQFYNTPKPEQYHQIKEGDEIVFTDDKGIKSIKTADKADVEADEFQGLGLKQAVKNTQKATAQATLAAIENDQELNGFKEGDQIVVTKEDGSKVIRTAKKEDVEAEPSIKLFHPTHTYLEKEVRNFEARDIHEDIFVNGNQVYEVPTVHESAQYFRENKELMWNEYLRLLNPEFYPVDLSTKCWENRKEILERVTKKSK